ncbi:MAG: hypothetical protein ACD_38C00106G0001 [uncultured bacterium]|uniref:Uncharacterized protein n=1 Tax=Candidatus Daviesbacteria bacterium GW2011_GWC2_40_12 TaxID=1618431 RepID=A0A0G0TV78_9BACT|nr:MAG: hypothetical protein ACD_38C00106G0001 [uncultured bacterium]KKR16547.1 MAG: hypothetical protein UT45_C0005G0076 [Candidatus Daviesbacteria bacterium GW2011_GWA2_39_33]KKR22282.1 MAG: hypothetical protein UT54_C0072G0006 [Candidatus Daviesbacteria bacterium GW2011_GWB1_39_5]KKR41812.1 MAG: hypothetical protein UT77_C0006G0044 [Candidatus Daviesbacteria bacterium GW2011_GWC2_40_12]OGE21108.1 MAG: hypothetical protein A2778_02670 [Candidatus Daviesbacteria bacterium RIFCSPHIGHO2_01_FULL_
MVETNGSKTVSLTNLQNFWREKLPAETEEKGTITPVGIILYAGKNKMVMIGSRTDGEFKQALACSYRDTPEGFDPNQVFDGKSRVLDLSNYEQLQVEQVSFAAVHMATFRSIRSLPSVNIRIPTINTLNSNKGIVNVDELEVLRFFAGETDGGIAVFSGANLPEDNALVLGRNTNGGKCGIALFMYPDINPVTALDIFDSVTGLYSFVKELNKELSASRIPLQIQSLAAYDRGLKNGIFNFEGVDVREEIFRTQIIANARLHAASLKSHQSQYMEFLHTHLPDLGTQNLARRFRTFLMKDYKNLQALADESIDRLILGGQVQDKPLIQPISEADRKEKNKNFFLNLKTSAARDIWQKVGTAYDNNDPYYGSNRWNFLIELINFVANITTSDEIDDAIVSLEKLEKSKFNHIYLNYELDMKDPINRIKESYGHGHKVEELFQFLMAEVLEKKKTKAPQIAPTS